MGQTNHIAHGTCARKLGTEVAAFLEHLKSLHYDESTVRRYAFSLREFMKYLGEKNISDWRNVQRGTLVEYLQRVSEKNPPNRTHERMRAVRKLLDWLEELGKLLANPAVGLAMPKLTKPLPRTILTNAEMKRLLNAPDTSLPEGIRDKAMLEVLYSCGLRLAELCHLTIHDVDIPAGYLRVNCGKGCKDRVVPMGRKATSYVNEYLRKVRGKFSKNRDERALFVGARCGRPIHPKYVTGLVHLYAQQAGIKRNITPHVFRHSCASHLLSCGADISQVKELLGHRLLSTTQIYTRVSQPEIKLTHSKTHPRERERQGV